MSSPPTPPSQAAAQRLSWPRRLLRGAIRWTLRAAVALLLLGLGLAIYLWWTRPVPTPPTQIYRGVTYECRRLPDTLETHGLAHLITVDLTAPGIELFITPTDPQAVAAGWEYRTRWTPTVARDQRTAVLVNGTLFRTASNNAIRLPGEYATSIETVIADHQVNHVWEHTYLLWFEDDLTPHVDDKPPKPDSMRKARWAIGSQGITYCNGRVTDEQATLADRRTLIGVDPPSKRLFIGVFDHASMPAGSRVLAEIGATIVVHVDGGTSTGLVLGPDARGVRPGAKVYPLRGIPVHFGVRAEKLPG